MNRAISARRTRTRQSAGGLFAWVPFRNGKSQPKVKPSEVIAFSRELATLLESGIPVVQALGLVAEQRKGDPMARIARRMVVDLHAGIPLARAMAAHPRVFNRIFIRTVATSDRGAPVAEVLLQAANFLDTADSAISQAKKALIYPAVVLTVGLGVIILLITVVLPSMTTLLENLDQGLPLPTKILIWLSDFLIAFKFHLLIGGTIIIISMNRYLKTQRGTWQFGKLMLRLPIVSFLVISGDISRASSAMASLTGAGLSLPEAIEVAAETSSNVVIRRALMRTRDRLIAGEGLSKPLASSGIFPKTFVQTLKVAEDTGTLGANLERMAAYYQRESESAVKSLVGLVEPLSTVFIAGLVGFIAMAVVMPMYSALGSLGQ